MKKILFISIAIYTLAVTANAQSGTNSPYSQFGLGVLSDQSQGMSRGMGGLSLGLRSGDQVNALNPASYSSVDSLTMLFDTGLSGQVTNFKEGGKKINANNANFEYVVGSFRMKKNLGFAFGLLPYSNIGYSYSSTNNINPGDASATYTTTFEGSGGVHQVFVGAGWKCYKGLSIGANLSYLWGSYSRSIYPTYSGVSATSISKVYSADIRSYKIDLGAQWKQAIDKNNTLTVGATFGIGHKLNSDATVATGGSYTDTLTVNNAFSIPTTIGIGFAWYHNGSIIIGADYTLQKWGSEDFPQYDPNDGDNHYKLKSGLLSDRHKVTVGCEWMPNSMSRKLYNRIRYRIGASYATPYIKVNGHDGPKELSVSAGFGIPISNSWNNKSSLNISGQFVHASAQDLIRENTFRINIGLTFNERWFMKWKVE